MNKPMIVVLWLCCFITGAGNLYCNNSEVGNTYIAASLIIAAIMNNGLIK